MFDSAKYRKMIESDLAELQRLQKEHEKRVEENSKRQKETQIKAKELERQGDQIQRQIDCLKQMAQSLDTPVSKFLRRQDESAVTAEMFNFKKSLIEPDRGLIKNVRAIMHGVGRHRMQPPDVRDILVECGYPNSKNLLSEIHAALRRLEKRGEITTVKLFDGRKMGYRSKGILGKRRSNTTEKNANE